MMQHTPGPWQVNAASWSENGFVQYELVGIELVTAHDARLIAAAPALLAACEAVIAELGVVPGDLALRVCAEAIAMARGEAVRDSTQDEAEKEDNRR